MSAVPPPAGSICVWNAFGEYACQRLQGATHIDPYSPPPPPPDRKFGGPNNGKNPYEFFTDAQPQHQEMNKKKSASPPSMNSEGFEADDRDGKKNMLNSSPYTWMKDAIASGQKEKFWNSMAPTPPIKPMPSAADKSSVKETFVYTADGVMASFDESTKRKTSAPEPASSSTIEGFCGCGSATESIGGFSV